jgi:hypothetical protein
VNTLHKHKRSHLYMHQKILTRVTNSSEWRWPSYTMPIPVRGLSGVQRLFEEKVSSQCLNLLAHASSVQASLRSKDRTVMQVCGRAARAVPPRGASDAFPRWPATDSACIS